VGRNTGSQGVNVDDNVYLGYNVGNKDRGSRNTFLGTEADVLTAAADEVLENATAIGYGARVGASNALVLGQGANVGIGTSVPTARLHVRSERTHESGLRLENLTQQSPAVASSDAFLSVNERGEVVKATYRARLSSPEQWADRVFADSYRLRPLAEVAGYVRQHRHLPDVPSAAQVAREGIDVAQMNATLLQKIEELTLYVIEQAKRIEQLEAGVR
jgi:trimeric autotransporter adhesin